MTMKKAIISWLFCLVTIYTCGQDFYLYYQGEKVCYKVSASKMLVKPERLDANDLKCALKNTVAGSIETIMPLSGGEFLVEMENTSMENMMKLIHQWHSRKNVIYASPVHVYEDGEAAGAYTNRLVVRLKSKGDYPVLQKCAGAYHITEIKNNEYDRLKYMLTLPRNTQKNIVDISNEWYETGFFEFATPDFIIFAQSGDGGNNNPYLPDRRGQGDEGSPFIVYPNPAKDVLCIDMERQTSFEYNVYNLHGRKALPTGTNDNNVKINVSVLQNGIYFLHLHDISSARQEVRKIVIKQE